VLTAPLSYLGQISPLAGMVPVVDELFAELEMQE
jgi:hypothetical protein